MLLLSGLVVGILIGWFLGANAKPERMPIPPPKLTTYASLSNDELKRSAAQLVTSIRALVRTYYDEDNRLRAAADENTGKTELQGERERMRKAWLEDSAKLHDTFMDRYKATFWADALLLREAFVAKVGGAPGARNAILFQQPTNMLGVEQVANSLDLLGKSLPAAHSSKP